MTIVILEVYPIFKTHNYTQDILIKLCLQVLPWELRLDVVVASCAFGMGIDRFLGMGGDLGVLEGIRARLYREKSGFTSQPYG